MYWLSSFFHLSSVFLPVLGRYSLIDLLSLGSHLGLATMKSGLLRLQVEFGYDLWSAVHFAVNQGQAGADKLLLF